LKAQIGREVDDVDSVIALRNLVRAVANDKPAPNRPETEA
jgi:hypothetical protein